MEQIAPQEIANEDFSRMPFVFSELHVFIAPVWLPPFPYPEGG
jgi:hypothetical protein